MGRCGVRGACGVQLDDVYVFRVSGRRYGRRWGGVG